MRTTTSKSKLNLKSKGADGSSNQMSTQDSRVQKASGHSRKVNTMMQDNMQFLKELQKNKSLKSLQ